MKKLGYWIYTTYNSIFNYHVNPLRNLPRTQDRIVITTILATLWSIAFGYTFKSYFYFGYTWAGHLMIIGMVFFTVHIFHQAEKNQDVWLLKFKHAKWLSKVRNNIVKKADYNKYWNDNSDK